MHPFAMDSIPVDIFHAIFADLLAASESLWTAFGAGPDSMCRGWTNVNVIDKDRLALPLIVSAVCRRWRKIAFDAPLLWRYLSVRRPTSARDCQHILDYVKFVILRSRNVSLDIYLDWEGLAKAEWDELAPHAAPILDEIAGLTERWRIVAIGFPNAAATSARMDMFTRRTPQLEELVIWRKDDKTSNPWRSDFPVYLPHRPMLRKMRTDGCHIIWTPPRLPSATLVTLELQLVNLPAEAIWNMLHLVPALELLDIELPHELKEWTPPAPALCLLSLRVLALRRAASTLFAHCAQHMKLPVLKALLLDGMDSAAPAEFARTFRDSITFLTFWSRMQLDDLFVIPLQILSNVRHLAIIAISVDASFFSQIDEETWPLLETIHLHAVFMDDDAAKSLIQVIRQKRSKRLTSVQLEACDVPKWLQNRINFHLKPVQGPRAQVSICHSLFFPKNSHGCSTKHHPSKASDPLDLSVRGLIRIRDGAEVYVQR